MGKSEAPGTAGYDRSCAVELLGMLTDGDEEADDLLCSVLRVRNPNPQALYDAREYARGLLADPTSIPAGSGGVGELLRRFYKLSVEEQEACLPLPDAYEEDPAYISEPVR